MRKLFLICLFLVACSLLFTFEKVKAENINYDEFVEAGFSKYLAQVLILQRNKHEGIPYERPSKAKEYLKSVFLNTDLAIPTQTFGYYDISPSE